MNSQPKPGMTYLFNADAASNGTDWSLTPIPKGTVVTRVNLLHTGGYLFNIEGSEELYHYNHGWAFVENTPENVQAFEAYREAYDAAVKATEDANAKFSRMTTLEA